MSADSTSPVSDTRYDAAAASETGLVGFEHFGIAAGAIAGCLNNRQGGFLYRTGKVLVCLRLCGHWLSFFFPAVMRGDQLTAAKIWLFVL